MNRMALKPGPESQPVEVLLERSGDSRGGQFPGDGFVVHVGDRRYEVEVHAPAPGRGWLHISRRIVPYHVVHRGADIEVWLDGRRFVLQKVRRASVRAAAPAAPMVDLRAPMPGTVLRLLVQAGDNVAQHQALVVLESMKMELTLSSAAAAKVAELLCREGELVQMGQALIRFENAETATEG